MLSVLSVLSVLLKTNDERGKGRTGKKEGKKGKEREKEKEKEEICYMMVLSACYVN